MNLYLLYGQESGYDTYDSCVVAAESEEIAKTIHPNSTAHWDKYSWASSPEYVEASLIGVAIEGTGQGVICASFNAG